MFFIHLIFKCKWVSWGFLIVFVKSDSHRKRKVEDIPRGLFFTENKFLQREAV